MFRIIRDLFRKRSEAVPPMLSLIETPQCSPLEHLPAELLDPIAKKLSSEAPPSTVHLNSAPECSPLERLPAELLDAVAKRLSSEAAVAALYLSSRVIMSKLGTKRFDKIRRYRMCYDSDLPYDVVRYNRTERNRLLTLLDHDSLSLIFCTECKMLHCPKKTISDRLKPSKEQLPCTKAELSRHNHYSHQDLSLAKIRTLMKLHRRSMDTTAALQDISKKCIFRGDGFTRYLTSLARIVDGRLLMRTEHCFVFSSSLFSKFVEPAFKIRRHDSATIVQIRATKGMALVNLQDRPCPFLFDYFTLTICTECRSAFEPSYKKIAMKHVYAITVWQDLGDGIACCAGRPVEDYLHPYSKPFWRLDYQSKVSAKVKDAFGDKDYVFNSTLSLKEEMGLCSSRGSSEKGKHACCSMERSKIQPEKRSKSNVAEGSPGANSVPVERVPRRKPWCC